MLVILEGLSVALLLLLGFNVIVFLAFIPEIPYLNHIGELFISKIIPITILVCLLGGLPLYEYTHNPEVQFRNCVETVQDKDFCELKYLKIPESKKKS